MTLQATMLAVPISAPGAPDVLVPQRVPLPTIGPNDVLIRIAAAGVNGPDLAQRRGQYDPPPGASPLPGLEVAGIIATTGDAVTGWTVGDRVMALTNGGGYAEYVAVPQGQVLPVPNHWSLVEAAALPETWFTVTQHLVMRAGIEPGMFVLVHGAAGGIGGAAVQITTILGGRAIAVVSSAEKAAYADRLGAVASINYARQDIVAETLELTGGNGADRVIDLIGGDMAEKNVAAAARFGHILQVSTLDGGKANISLRTIMAKQLTLSGSTLRPQTAAIKAAIASRIRADLLPALGQPGFIRPAIATLPLAEAVKAHAAMEARRHMGKIVLVTAFGADGE